MQRHFNFSVLRKLGQLFCKYLLRRTKDAMILRVASSLSYTTLIAVVPLIAIALSVFTAFPVFENVRAQVQNFLIQYFVPDIEQNVQIYISRFIGAAAKLSAAGIIGIAVTAVLLLFTIENSFNFIFKVKRHRRIATKITLYWTVITLCPLLLGAAFSFKGYILTLKYFQPDHFSGLDPLITVAAPNLITLFVLILSYVIVPNKKVRFSSAIYGGTAAFLLILALRFGFGFFLTLNITYKTLYGALAAIPILLVWMYCWWTIVLFGAVITAALEDFRNRRKLWKRLG